MCLLHGNELESHDRELESINMCAIVTQDSGHNRLAFSPTPMCGNVEKMPHAKKALCTKNVGENRCWSEYMLSTWISCAR